MKVVRVLIICVSSLLLMNRVIGLASIRRRPPRIRPNKPSSTSHSTSSIIDENKKSIAKRKHQQQQQQQQQFDEKDDNSSDDITVHRNQYDDTIIQQGTAALLSNVSFSSNHNNIHPLIQKALVEDLQIHNMTQIQALTYSLAIQGHNIMAISETGSGKTLAYLIPSLQRLIQGDLNLYRPGQSIGMVILAPTRELVIQIANQAEILCTYVGNDNQKSAITSFNVVCLYGGVKIQRDIHALSGYTSGSGALSPSSRLPTVLVSTPGRLLDHLENNIKIGRRKFVDIIDETKIIVLDETDRLFLSQKHEMDKLLTFMARSSKRQTLLFSATFPKLIRQSLKDTVLKGQDVLEVDCIHNNNNDVGNNGKSKQNNNITSKSGSQSNNRLRIEQSYVTLKDISQYVPMLLAIIRQEQRHNTSNYKILVFFPASRLVRFFYQFFTLGGIVNENNNNNNDNIWEIHSRMSQASRTRSSNQFRSAKHGILFSSDVSARGMDYPDVTIVVQMGLPSNKNEYIHRIGRTGRAGQSGKSILVLLPFERHTGLTKKGSKEDTILQNWVNDDDKIIDSNDFEATSVSGLCQHENEIESIRWKVRSGHTVLTPSAESAYKAFLAHYISTATNANGKVRSKKLKSKDILAYAEEFAEAIGLADPPVLDSQLASKMGL